YPARIPGKAGTTLASVPPDTPPDCTVMTEAELHDRILGIATEAGATHVAVATHDFEHDRRWSLNGDRWFHAASTIKVPVLLGVFDAIAQSRFEPHSRVHVRNRFLSVVDEAPYR